MSDNTADTYQEIRPYYDHEVQPALQRLMENEEFINTLTDLNPKMRGALLRPLKKYLVKRKISGITRKMNSVLDVQELVKKFLDDMLATSVDEFTVSGLHELMDQHEGPFLFVGNHRDIVLDPALINYALHTNGFDTSRIAIGDNLLSTSFVGDLMKLNKSLIVKRSIARPREKLMALKSLSAYMHHSLTNENSSIWIAQSEGRAKDGIDKTQPAIIKMIAIAKDRSQSLEEYIRSVNIVPVAISYQYDPCDADKAKELHVKAAKGSYTKSKDEDFQSIMKGINGYKGDVHVGFGKPLSGDLSSAELVATAIDEQIYQLYRIHDTNQAAHDYITSAKEGLTLPKLSDRIAALPKDHQPYVWQMYANAVRQRSDSSLV